MNEPNLKRVLIPDLPAPALLLPYLQRMHEARRYSNFGPLLQEFEAGFAALDPRLHETPQYAVSACSGTGALELALAALQLPQGARALIPSLTFPATAQAAMRVWPPRLAPACTRENVPMHVSWRTLARRLTKFALSSTAMTQPAPTKTPSPSVLNEEMIAEGCSSVTGGLPNSCSNPESTLLRYY